MQPYQEEAIVRALGCIATAVETMAKVEGRFLEIREEELEILRRRRQADEMDSLYPAWREEVSAVAQVTRLRTELARMRDAMGGAAIYANADECLKMLDPLDVIGEPNTLLALTHKAVQLALRTEKAEAELARVGEIAQGADDGGHWYSQQTMDAVSGERDTLRAELARVRAVAKNCPGWGEPSPCGLEKESRR